MSRGRSVFDSRTRRIIRCKNLALYIRDCVSLCLSDETLTAVGPFYLVQGRATFSERGPDETDLPEQLVGRSDKRKPQHEDVYITIIIILVLPPGVVCLSNRALPMLGTADGDAVNRCQVLGRAGSVHHGTDQ